MFGAFFGRRALLVVSNYDQSHVLEKGGILKAKMASRFSGLAQLTGGAAKLRISAATRSAPVFASRPAVSFSPQAALLRAFHSSPPSLAKAKVATHDTCPLVRCLADGRRCFVRRL